jgi:hypothetical protein
MSLATLLLADGRGDNPSTLGGIAIIVGILVLVAVVVFLFYRFVIVAKRSSSGDTTSEGGTQPPGRVGRL